jgi:nucleoid-associated protein YgaU
MSLVRSALTLAGTDDALVRAVLVVSAVLLVRPALALVASLATALPGRVGRLAAGAAAALRPGIARRLLAAALGLGVPAVAALSGSPAVSARGLDARAPAEVVVAPGDNLWDIARRHLPPGSGAAAVATAWPQWYAANRDRIGPDPSLLHVGTRLRVPDLRRTGTSASQHHRPSPVSAPSRTSAQSLDPDRR